MQRQDGHAHAPSGQAIATHENFSGRAGACYPLGDVFPRTRSVTLRLRARDLFLGALSALGSFALASSPGCGTDAKGIDDCRDIEQARCRAAAACGLVPSEDDCERFYRDHCLHGLPVPAPDRAQVDLCVADLTKLGNCAEVGGGKDATLDGCPEFVDTRDATLACEVIQHPERAYSCSFLTGKTAVPPAGGQGGEGGGGG